MFSFAKIQLCRKFFQILFQIQSGVKKANINIVWLCYSYCFCCVSASLPNLFTGKDTFTGEKSLRATRIFIKIKLQIIASLVHNIGAASASVSGICPQKQVMTKKKRSSPQIQTDFELRIQKKVLV